MDFLERRLGQVSVRTAIIFTLINTIFLLLLGDIFIRLFLFMVCAIFLYFFGKLPFVDLDPVPFVTAIHYLLYGFLPSLQFIVWTIPAADVIANRLSQWSLVNLISLAFSITISYLIKNFLSTTLFLSSIIILHNLARIVISLAFFKANFYELKAPLSNTFVYLILINALGFYI